MARLLLLFAALFTAMASGQDCTQTVQVGAIDERTGGVISPLTPDLLQARIGNTFLPITSLDRVRTRRIVVLVDESGSMTESPDPFFLYQGPALHAMKQALRDLMEELPSGVSVEYGLFNDKWVFSDGFISDPGEIHKSIDDVTARFGKTGHGRTAIFDALHQALLQFGTPQPGDSILLLTDGVDSISNLAAKKLEHEFHSANTRLLIMLVLRRGFEPETFAAVQYLVPHTGGSSLTVDTTSASWTDEKYLSQNLQVVRRFWNDKVVAGYVARVHVPDTLKDEKKWTLSVNRRADPRLRHAVTVYPDHLSPCPVTTATAR